MRKSLIKTGWHYICIYMRLVVFFLYIAVLVSGIFFWGALLLLHGDITALALASENLISRYLAASFADKQNFLNMFGLMAFALYIIVAGFRWPCFWRAITSENKQHMEQPDV